MENEKGKNNSGIKEYVDRIVVHDRFEQKLDDSTLLARIDERTRTMSDKIEHLEKVLEEQYVTQKEFAPVRSVVFGMIGVMLLSVLGGIITLVIRK